MGMNHEHEFSLAASSPCAAACRIEPRPAAAAQVGRAVLAVAVSVLAACGGGGSPPADAQTGVPTTATPTPVTPPPAPPAPPTPPSVAGKVMLYLATSETTKTYDPYTGITIDTSGPKIFRFVPELRLLDEVAWNSSASYATDQLLPYTVDDRLFFVSGSPDTSPGQQRWMEADPLSTSSTLGSQGRLLQDGAYQRGCGAVVGQRLFYQGRIHSDLFGTQYGDLRVVTLGVAGAASTRLLPRGDADQCRYHLNAAGGRLYDAEYDAGAGLIQLHRRSLESGRIVKTAPITVSDAADWGAFKFAFDDGVGYLARRHRTDQRVQVWRLRFDAPQQVDLVYEATVPDFNLAYLDSDDGYVLLADGIGRKALVVDAHSGVAELHPLPFKFADPQILHLRP